MADDLQTINPDQLPVVSTPALDSFVLIQAGGGPIQKVPFDALLVKLIAAGLVKTSEAVLQGDLAWDADTVALVDNDPDPLKNGWYRKVGASGAGEWVQFEQLSKAVLAGAVAAREAAELAAAALQGALDDVAYLMYNFGGGVTIATFTANPAAVELGPNPTNVTLAWTIEGTITGQALEDSVAGAVALDDPLADRTKVVLVGSSRTFTLTAENTGAPGGTDSKSRQVIVPQHPRRFWGVADTETLDSAGVIALASSELSGARAKTFTVDGGSGAGKFVYFAYLATLGDPAGYKLLAYDDDPVITTVSVTTAAGHTANYKVLRSPNRLTGAVLAEIS